MLKPFPYLSCTHPTSGDQLHWAWNAEAIKEAINNGRVPWVYLSSGSVAARAAKLAAAAAKADRAAAEAALASVDPNPPPNTTFR